MVSVVIKKERVIMTTFEDTMEEKKVQVTKVAKDAKKHQDEAHLAYPMTDEMRKMMADSYKVIHK